MAISAVGFAAQLDAQAVQGLGEDLRDRAAEISRMLSGRPLAAGR
jgi:DNA-binding IclR family transcriptional regulator